MYYNGEGVSKGYKKAFEWYEKVAKKGDARAQSILGSLYATDQGVLKDYTQAYTFFNLALSASTETQRKEINKVLNFLEEKMTSTQITELSIDIESSITHKTSVLKVLFVGICSKVV